MARCPKTGPVEPTPTRLGREPDVIMGTLRKMTIASQASCTRPCTPLGPSITNLQVSLLTFVRMLHVYLPAPGLDYVCRWAAPNRSPFCLRLTMKFCDRCASLWSRLESLG